MKSQRQTRLSFNCNAAHGGEPIVSYDYVILHALFLYQLVDEFSRRQVIINHKFTKQMQPPAPFLNVIRNHVRKGIGNVNVKWTMNFYSTPNLTSRQRTSVIIHSKNC